MIVNILEGSFVQKRTIWFRFRLFAEVLNYIFARFETGVNRNSFGTVAVALVNRF